jgi:hypothetical protein
MPIVNSIMLLGEESTVTKANSMGLNSVMLNVILLVSVFTERQPGEEAMR